MGIFGVSLLNRNQKLNKLPASSARFRFRPGEPIFTGQITLDSFEDSTLLIRTADGQQDGSTTAPRSGDGDRPQGDPKGEGAAGP
jgi:hypothetical protein